MVTIDIACGLMDVDETDFVWTSLRDAHDPTLIKPSALVLAGDTDARAVAEVVYVVNKPVGKVLHLRLLPGHSGEYAALVHRVLTDE